MRFSKSVHAAPPLQAPKLSDSVVVHSRKTSAGVLRDMIDNASCKNSESGGNAGGGGGGGGGGPTTITYLYATKFF